MSRQLFIQKFHQGEPVTMPYDEVIDCLIEYGPLGRGPVGDIEITFKPDEIAHYGLLVGDEAQGVQCVALIRPIIDNAMRRLVFELMTHFGACLFDDALGTAYGVGSAVSELPPMLAAACRLGVQPISSPQQLWPESLFFQEPVRESPALIFENPNPQGIRYVLFDWMEAKNKALLTQFSLRPEACNAATLRVLCNMLLKVDAALWSNPDFSAVYRFTHHETSLHLMQAPKISETKNKATFIMSGDAAFFGAEEVSAPFLFDPELYFTNREKSAALQSQAKTDFQITIEPGASGITALEKLLELLHRRYLAECGGAPAGHVFSETALRWADRAGAFLGERIRSEIGGQWGRMEIMGRETLVVQTHTGRACWPKHKVLNRIINGPGDSVSDYFAELLENAKTPSTMDIVADIPLISHILTGRGNFSDGGLPLAQQLPSSQLDFSVQSLHALDRYLAAVHAQKHSLEEKPHSNLVVGAGAYIGEVLRRNANKTWDWINYADYFSTRPANADIPENINSCAMLVGSGFVVLPMQASHAAFWGAAPGSTHAQVCEWLKLTDPQATSEAQAAANGAPGQPAGQDSAAPQSQADMALEVDIGACVAALQPQERGYLQIAPPSWIHGDPLERLCEAFPQLLEHGRVVWARLVQANDALFHPGDNNSPAEVLYDPQGRLTPQELAPLARRLFELKNTQPLDAGLARIAEHLTAEITRAFGMAVPPGISNKGLLISTVLVMRQHLPNRRLSLGYFPVLISERCPGCAMILPSRWWPQALIQAWGAEDAPEAKAQPQPAPQAKPADTSHQPVSAPKGYLQHIAGFAIGVFRVIKVFVIIVFVALVSFIGTMAVRVASGDLELPPRQARSAPPVDQTSPAYQAACHGPPLRNIVERNKALEDGYIINRQYECIDKASFLAEEDARIRWEAANTPEAKAQAAARLAKKIAQEHAQATKKAVMPESSPKPATPLVLRHVDVNTATAVQMAEVAGVGPVIASQIIEARRQGRFGGWADLVNRVIGLSAAKTAAYASIGGLTVDGQPLPGAPADAGMAAMIKEAAIAREKRRLSQ